MDPQESIAINQFNDLVTTLKLGNQNMSQLIQQIITRFGAESATASALGLTTAASSGTQIKIGSGYLISLAVVTASSVTSAVGTFYDSPTIIGLGSSCAIGLIPSSGTVIYNWPYSRGLVITTASSTQVVAVSYV